MEGILPCHCVLPAPCLWPLLLCWVANSLWEARNKTSPSLEVLWMLYLVIQELLWMELAQCRVWAWCCARGRPGRSPQQQRAPRHPSSAHWTCIPGVWAMEDRSCFLGRPFALEQQPGVPAVWPCLSFPSPVSTRADAVAAPSGDGPARGWLWRTRGGSSGL